MTRGRAIWLALLAVGLIVSLVLHAPRPRSASSPEAKPAARSTAPRSDDEGEFVEIEVADPGELGVTERAQRLAPEAPDEAELVRTLGALWQSDPERALALAEDGERRFGESSHAVERRLFEIKALVKLERIGSARTKAERYLAAYPPGPMTDEVERLTGVHRRPEP